ncbi:hypothetical protein QO034_04210 [Sedimentitalea sp. JM2-8]|uniref:Surface antigen domain-containing protein n=1 Tax=Sedimentitalea xiamensis TaxID=3050037 RepID=A0ABT7FB32_9RHOB|nr:hypothetical protein [Sedimentitalea xiamensis]MDK3072306.1 hypothetical protein [Sedimentitalea xiamensis]
MSRFLCLMVLPFLLAAAPAPGVAKSLSRIIADFGVSPQDFDLMWKTESTLYETASPTPGKTARWENPQSGSKGSVTLEKMQGNCAYLHHVIHAKDRKNPLELRNRMCRSPDGRWRVTP